MKNYWFLFFIGIFSAIFSKQIDTIIARAIKSERNRAIFKKGRHHHDGRTHSEQYP